jgi:hypothetical protein
MQNWNPTLNATRKFLLLVAGIAGVMCTSCSHSEPGGITRLRTSDLTAPQTKQQEIAVAARDKMFGALFQELMTSMASVGPAKSIAVCQEKAPQIASQVSEESGVRIGRTSIQLRNTDNRPPKWAEMFVQERVGEEVLVELPDEALGVLLPIRLNATCTVCHGKSEEIAPEVQRALRASYPQDKAVGFAEGDLRGYFWVEVPKQQ